MSRHIIDDEELRLRLPPSQWEAIREWIEAQPGMPRLVGSTAASKILGVKPPHISRLKDQGRMPEPIPVEGSADVYIREEVVALGRQLKRERAARAAKREDKA